MTIYLDEDMFGSAEIIGFPKLKICMGFVALIRVDNKTFLSGVHLVNKDRTKDAISIFNNELIGNISGRKLLCLFGSCNRVIRYGNGDAKQNATSWRDEMQEIAGMIGYKGSVRGFDTSVIGPRAEGTYVQYQIKSENSELVRIFYKQDDRIEYGVRGGKGKRITFGSSEPIPDDLPIAAKVKLQAKRQTTTEAYGAVTSMDVKRKRMFGEKSLNEVDYSLRLETTTV